MHHTFHKHRQEGNQPQWQGVQDQENGHGQNGTHRIFLHTVILSLTLNPRVGWSFSTGCLSQPIKVNVRKRRKKTLTNANYAKKPSALATCQESNFFKSGGHPKFKIFLSLHKNELLAIPATCFTSAQQHSEAICPRLYEHRPCCVCHFASRREGTKGKKKRGSTCSKALWSAALRS